MSQLTIGQYIFTRLKQLGLQTVFGVPGGKKSSPSTLELSNCTRLILKWLLDYELVILDMIPDAGLTWRGNPNELIASYAVWCHSIFTACALDNKFRLMVMPE